MPILIDILGFDSLELGLRKRRQQLPRDVERCFEAAVVAGLVDVALLERARKLQRALVTLAQRRLADDRHQPAQVAALSVERIQLRGHVAVVGARFAGADARSITTLYGNVELDLTQAPLEPGDQHLRLVNIGDHIRLRVPKHIGIQLDATSIVADMKLEHHVSGEQQTLEQRWLSDHFDRASTRLVLSVYGAVAELTIVQPALDDVDSSARLLEGASPPAYRLPGYEGATQKLRRP